MAIELPTINTILAALPEPLELLLFGIGLVAAVVLLRWFLNRGEAQENDEEFTN